MAHPFKKNKRFLHDGDQKDCLKRPLIGLKSFTLGTDIAEALALNLKLNTHLGILVLRNTNLNNQIFKLLLDSFPVGLKKLDIS